MTRTPQPKSKLTDDSLALGAKAVEHAIRFSGLANGGGVIATITVLGATAKNGAIENVLAIPLGFFLLVFFLPHSQLLAQCSSFGMQ